MSDTLELTREQLNDIVEQEVGKQAAEMRKEAEAKNKELEDKINLGKATTKDMQAGGIISMPQPDLQEKGVKAARFMRLMTAAQGNPMVAAELAKRWGDDTMVKALGESTLAAGGAAVPEDFASEIVEILRNQGTIRQLGPRVLPMPNGNFTLPYGASGSTAYFVGENTNATKSEPTFGQIQMTAKKLMALVPISNELLMDSDPAIDAFVRDDLIAVISEREDLAFISGDGTANSPRGLASLVDSGNSFAANATVTLANTTTDSAKAMRLIEDQKIPMRKLGWVFAPRTKWYLMSVRTSDGYLAFESEMRLGTYMGAPFKSTAQIPINLGGGTNESKNYLADFGHLIIGEAGGLEVDAIKGAAYHDGSSVVSGVSQDQTVIVGKRRIDFQARFRGKEIAVMTGVKWGV